VSRFSFFLARFPRSHRTILLAESLTLIKEKQNAHAEKYGQSITDVKFSPDGSKIVSCGVDQTIKVWDLIFWSREHHLLFSQATQRCVVLLLWLNKHKLQLPEEILDMLIRACI
jgi:WD40 repeat protein